MKARVEIEWIGRACPVQAEGTINGVPFYFRARGQSWKIGIGNNPAAVAMNIDKTGWKKSEPWGEKMYDAGWMSEETAKEIIERCAEEYVNQEVKDK